MKGGSMLERTNKRLILNGNCRTIIENNEYMITQVSDPTGDGLMTMYHVFPVFLFFTVTFICLSVNQDFRQNMICFV